jgi:Lon-like protease
VIRITPMRLAAAAGLVVLALIAVGLALAVIPSDSYIFLPDRAHAVDPLVTVEGVRTHPDKRGGIYFVDVFVRRASLLEERYPWIHSGARLHPATDVKPPGESERERRQADLQAMARSQQRAAAVALRALGYKVQAEAVGALIDDVDPTAPAAGRLQPGDVVIAADGRRVRTPSDLQRVIFSHQPPEVVQIRLQRGSHVVTVALRTAADPSHGGRARIGVAVSEAAKVKLPVDVRINAGNIGGPSAGLAFALDVMEELGRDVDHGLKVAATGDIELNGAVAPVGGLEQKTLGARRSHVDVFLVPAGENAATARRYADGLNVIPVTSFQQALRALATLRPA